MTPDQYVISIAKKYYVQKHVDFLTNLFVVEPLKVVIRQWAGSCLQDIYLSGSRAKGTAISLSSDLDLFISLKSDTENMLQEIYNSLDNFLTYKGYTTRRQNVSIGVRIWGNTVDLVPAKKRPGNTNLHSLYISKRNTWTQTNVKTHINKVLNSGRITEIVLLKIWRKRHGLDFPSIYLELSVIEALKGKNKSTPASNFITLLEYLKTEFVGKTVYDPANTNNIISDDLYKYEKEAIRKKAAECLTSRWENVIW